MVLSWMDRPWRKVDWVGEMIFWSRGFSLFARIGMWEKVGRKDHFCCSHCTNVYTNLSYTETHSKKKDSIKLSQYSFWKF
jgi:hypothetical protein